MIAVIEGERIEKIESQLSEVCQKLLSLSEVPVKFKDRLTLTAAEVAEWTGYSIQSITKKKHEIGFSGNDKFLLFKPQDVMDWIERDYTAPKSIKYIAR